jgi:DNA-directed RNA polymerase specialized sigma24 family protein
MVSNHNFSSPEELVKRLQVVFRDLTDASSAFGLSDANLREARNLAAELAGRVYDEPGEWGVGEVPERFRDDAAADALVQLLVAVPAQRGRQSIVSWFAKSAEESFQRSWADAQQAEAEAERLGPPPAPAAEEPVAPAVSVFDAQPELWGKFEQQFPRDAFALRVRFLLNRTPEEMAVMLDAPNERAITMRLHRARDRFQLFCEQAGLDRREVSALVASLSTGEGA